MEIIVILGIFIGVLVLSALIASKSELIDQEIRLEETRTLNRILTEIIAKNIGASLKTAHQSDEEVRKVLAGLLPTKTKSKKKKVAKQ